MSNEIQSSNSAPYVGPTNTELYKLQYGALLAGTGNNPYIAPELFGGDATGTRKGGPVIASGINTDDFIAKVNTATGKDLSADIIGGTSTVVTYGTNNNLEPPARCNYPNGGRRGSWKKGNSSWNAECEEQPPTPVVKPALKLDQRVLIPSSTDVTNVSSGVVTTTVFNDASDAFAGLKKLITDNGGDANSLNGELLNIKIHSAVESGGGEPISDKFGFDDPAVIPAINTLYNKSETVQDISDTVNRLIGVTQVGSPNFSQTENAPEGNPYWADQADVLAKIATLNPDWDTQIALRRLNLIPVALRDRLLATIINSDGDPEYSLDPDVLKTQQITLMESAWTLWQSVSAINTEVFGVSALSGVTSSTLSADSLYPELSGSVRENLNFLYDALMGDTDIGSESGDIGDAPPGEVEKISLTKIKKLLYGTEYIDNPDSFVDPLTGSTISNINTLYTTLTAIEDRVDNIPSENFEVDIAGNETVLNINNDITSLYTQVSAISGDVDTLDAGLADLQTTVYGVSGADNRDTFNEAASGESVVSNINTLWTNMLSLVSTAGPGADLQSILDKLDSISDAATLAQLNEITTKLNNLDGLAAQVTTNTAEISGNDQDIITVNENLEARSAEITENTAKILQLTEQMTDALDATNLTEIVQVIESVEIDDLVAKINQVMADIGDLEGLRDDVDSNTTDVATLSGDVTTNTTELTALIQKVDGLSTLDGVDQDDMQTIINNITNINDLNSFIDLINVLEANLQTVSASTDQNTGDIAIINTKIDTLSGEVVPDMIDDAINAMDLVDLPGYVKTSGTQSVSGEKTFQDTLTVSASSNFTDHVTIGDTAEDRVVDIRSEGGSTIIELHGLGDAETYAGRLYTKVVNIGGETFTVLAITPANT